MRAYTSAVLAIVMTRFSIVSSIARIVFRSPVGVHLKPRKSGPPSS